MYHHEEWQLLTFTLKPYVYTSSWMKVNPDVPLAYSQLHSSVVFIWLQVHFFQFVACWARNQNTQANHLANDAVRF